MGERLKLERLKHGMTQESLAKLSGVSRQTISSLENDRCHTVSVSTLVKLSNALNVPVKIFFAKGV